MGGDVSAIDSHQSYCQHANDLHANDNEYHLNTDNRLKKMKVRVLNCEKLISEKDVQITELKCSNSELESEVQRLRVLFEEEKLHNNMRFKRFENQLRVMKKEIGK